MEHWIFYALSVLLALFIGSFLRPYLTKKGENLATHEDIQKLVDQVRAVTLTTEEIKSSISTGAWKRDLKKEACYELLKQLEPMARSLAHLAASRSNDNPEVRRQAHVEFTRAYGSYLNAELIVEMVGSNGLQEARREMTKTVMQAQRHVEANNLDETFKALARFANANADFLKACRKELGFEDEVR
ncbi:MAG TPA: hypothetical protein VGQ49_08200 [Bryobacteraceae bacterium]|jgi:hypothetical protein|nr:hypothetical protein [Bryobacteraceae bacterium]